MDMVVSTFPRRWPGITYLLQVLLLYIVIVASIVNLSLGRGNDKVWLGLLTSSIGLLLPNPRFEEVKTGSVKKEKRTTGTITPIDVERASLVLENE